MLKNFKFITVAMSIMLCFSAIAFGQGTTGSIAGTVSDANGAVIPGATVRVESTGTTTGLNRTVTADDEGYFILARLAPGVYKVTIEANGFASSTKNVTVTVDRAAGASVRLQPTGVTTTVDVVADSAVTIDQSSTKIDTNITKEIIDSLPKGTTFGSLLKIAPNVRPEALGGGFQIDGASGSENVFVIDGQEVTNFATGTLNANNNLPFELLQEVQVKSTGFEAEYGGATGGVINAVTAGGNNELHGNFGISFVPKKFRGDFTPTLNDYGNGPGEFDYFTRRNDGGLNYFPVASLSGPIVKDRVWGLVSYAPQIFETDRTKDYYNTDDPGRNVIETNRYRSTVRREAAFARVDAQPFSSLRVYGTFLWNPQSTDGEVPTSGLTQGPPPISVETYAGYGGRVNSNAWNGQATWNPNNWLILSFRAGRSFLNEKLGAYGRTAAQRFAVSTGSPLDPCDPADLNFPGRTTECRGFNTGSNSLTNFDVSTRTTYDADASFVGINAGGRHNIKVGYQLNKLYNNVDSGYTSAGYLLLYYGRPINVYTGSAITPMPNCDFQNFNPNDTTCSLGTARMVRIGTFGEASSDNTSIYAQDSWTINDRLTINFGLRLENEVVPTFSDPTTTDDITFGWGDKLAPRFGAAFDLTGDGKTKLFGSYGWFYDRFKYELPRGLFGAETFQDAFAEITPARGLSPFDYTLANMLGGRGIIPGGACPIANPTGYAVCELDRRVPSNTTGADPFAGTGAVDPNLKAMRQSEYTFGLERELGSNFVLAARYTHKQLDRAIEDIGAFNDQGSEAYVIGNPGIGLACEISMSSGLPCTRAERKYDAVEVRVDKRAAKYFFNASYTWSRLFGNYSGLASSDELGRTSPNVNRFFDLPMLGYDASGRPDNGLLGTDRPHVVKAYGGYSFDWGDGSNTTSVSGFTTFQSGTPITTVYDLFGVTTSILNGRGDLGRTPMFSESDISVSHAYKFGRDNNWTFQPFIEIRNVFDENNVTTRQRVFSGSNITDSQLRAAGCAACTDEVASFQQLLVNGGILQFVNTHFANNPTTVENDYGQDNGFQVGRDVRFGFKFKF
ncbi:MAG: TonB-dependent receptor [Pyrinomonadaceae bacterium]|nr:TonB-dependent receptor [Pyrinomonadaceae bacterium]